MLGLSFLHLIALLFQFGRILLIFLNKFLTPACPRTLAKDVLYVLSEDNLFVEK